MDKIDMHEAIDHDRRRFFGAAALTLTAAELGVIGAAHAETKPAPLSVIKPGTNTSFAPLKQIDAGMLNVGHAEAGPPNGSPVILLLHPEHAAYAKYFTGRYEHRQLTGGIGHNLPQEAPQAFAEALVNVAQG
jgi:hypothetical protein